MNFQDLVKTYSQKLGSSFNGLVQPIQKGLQQAELAKINYQRQREMGQTPGQQIGQRFVPMPRNIVNAASKTYNLLGSPIIQQNPLTQFSSGLISGQNLGQTPAALPPTRTMGKLAFGAGSLIGAMNPKSLTGRVVGPIVKGTNPIISKAIGPLAGRAVSGRIAAGIGNVAQGAAINPIYGRKPLEGAAIDFATGVAFGPNQFKSIGKGMIPGRNRTSTWAPDELGMLDQINEFLHKNKELENYQFNKLDSHLTALAQSHIPEKTIQKLANDYGSNDVGFIKALTKELLKDSKRSNAQANYSWDLGMGLAENKPKGVGEINQPELPKTVTEAKLNQKGVPNPLPETQQNTLKAALPNDSTKVKIGNTSSVYNVGRINGNQEVVKKAVEEVAPAFEKVAGKPISHKEVIDQSEKFSSDVVKTIGRQTTEQLGAAQLRLRQNIASMADSGQVTPELLEAMKTDAAFARSNAQLLGQRAIDANPQTAYGKNLVKYVEAVNKVADDIDAVYERAKGVDFNNKEQATAFYREFIKPATGDWLDKVRYSSMLSSPNTVINNASSNWQGTGILAPIEKTVSGGLDAIVSGITGRQRQHFAGEGVEYAKGYVSNLKPALTNFVDAMKGGSDAAEMYDVPLTKPGTVSRVGENFLSFFPRLAQATDEFFTALTGGGLEKANKYRISKGGAAQTADQIALESKRRLFNQPFGTDQSHMLNLIEFIPSKIMEAAHSKNPFVKWTAKFIFPFVRIPANVFKAGVEYSPLGISTLPGANNKIEQASKTLMGTSVALGAWSLANSGRLTFGMPTSEKQRDAFTAAGLQPYSVKIGDKWIGYTKFHPAIGFNMALASAVKEQMDNQTVSDSTLDQVIGIAGKWLTYFANQSYVKQMGDFMDLSKGNEAAIGKAIGNYPSQLIPYRAFMGWLARAFDPYERKIDPDGSQLDKSLQSIMMSIPGLRGKLKPRLDSSGQPVEQQNRFLNLVSPGKVTQEVSQEKAKFDTMVQKSKDTKQENAIKEQMKKSGAPISEYKGKIFISTQEFDTETGEYKTVIKSIDPNKAITPPKLTGSAELDKKIMSKFSSQITSKTNDILSLYQLGKISADDAETQLQQLKALKASYSTGTKKLKKIKPIKVKIPKMKTIKVKSLKLKKPKKIKVTVKKMKRPKILTTKA
jgi:hypothetical protein